MDRQTEQDRLKDEEYRLEQDQIKEFWKSKEEDECREEQRQALEEASRREHEEESDREYDEWVRDEEAERGFDSDLPPVAIEFDQNLYHMYRDMCSWKPPFDARIIPMLRVDPPALYTLVFVGHSELMSFWGRPRLSREFIHRHLDGVVTSLRERNAEKRSRPA